MKENQSSNEHRKPEPIFGKKFNLWGGIFLAILIVLAVYRHISMDKPFGMVNEEPEQQETVDSLNVE